MDGFCEIIKLTCKVWTVLESMQQRGCRSLWMQGKEMGFPLAELKQLGHYIYVCVCVKRGHLLPLLLFCLEHVVSLAAGTLLE